MAPISKVNICFAVIFCFTQSSYCSWVHSSVHRGWKLKWEGEVSVTAADPMECLRRCLHLHSSLCSGVSFDAAAARCTHFTKENARLLINYGSSYDTTVFTEWTSGVIVAEQVSFEETSSVCESLRGHVMTNTELDQLFTAGTEPITCSCGWLSDGSKKMVRRPDTNCGPSNDIYACSVADATQ